jgi:acylphosphatase
VAALACLHAIISGRVQGVFYRDFVSRRAVELGLSGYVHNLVDGERVEVRAEGDEESLEKFLGYLRVGPPAARVDKVAANWPAYTGSFTGFSVRY